MIDKFRAERLGEAWVRASALVSLIDARGTDVDAEDIQRAALVPLTDQAAQAALNLSAVVLMNMDALTAVLAGCCPEDRIAIFANWPMSVPKAQTRRCPRRPRPTAAERAIKWLEGPSREIVDPDAPDPSPNGVGP